MHCERNAEKEPPESDRAFRGNQPREEILADLRWWLATSAKPRHKMHKCSQAGILMHLCISLDNHTQFLEVGFDLDQQVLIGRVDLGLLSLVLFERVGSRSSAQRTCAWKPRLRLGAPRVAIVQNRRGSRRKPLARDTKVRATPLHIGAVQ